MRYQGNIKFRKLIQNHLGAYREAYRHASKDAIAQQVVDVVLSRGGRFLRRVESITEATELVVPPGVEAWREVDRENVIAKCKQAFRDEKRAASEIRDGDLGLPSAERSSEREGSSEPALAASVGASSLAPGLVGLQDLVSLQQRQQHSVLSSSGHGVGNVQRARQQPNDRTQIEMDLLQCLIHRSQSAAIEAQQSSIADQLPQLRYLPSLSSFTSAQHLVLMSERPGNQRQQNSDAVAGGGTDHSLSLVAARQRAMGASSAAAQASSTSMAVNTLLALLNRQNATSLGDSDHQRVAAVRASSINQDQQAPPQDRRRQPETLSQILAAHQPPANGKGTAARAPLSLHPEVGVPFLPVSAPPDILEERARLADDALRRYQILRGCHSPEQKEEERNSSRTTSSDEDEDSTRTSLSVKKKSPVA